MTAPGGAGGLRAWRRGPKGRFAVRESRAFAVCVVECGLPRGRLAALWGGAASRRVRACGAGHRGVAASLRLRRGAGICGLRRRSALVGTVQETRLTPWVCLGGPGKSAVSWRGARLRRGFAAKCAWPAWAARRFAVRLRAWRPGLPRLRRGGSAGSVPFAVRAPAARGWGAASPRSSGRARTWRGLAWPFWRGVRLRRATRAASSRGEAPAPFVTGRTGSRSAQYGSPSAAAWRAVRRQVVISVVPASGSSA